MMSNKTAMQEMLEWIRKTLPMDLDTPRMIEAKIESLLNVEKEQIKDAYTDGCIGELYELNAYYTSEKYYKETYANDTTTGLPEEDSKRRAWHY
jgi:hypothetical protein